MVYTYTTNVNKDEVDLKRGAYCYGLPYGYFGLICWGLSILAIALTYANITLFAFWRGCRPYYKSQSGWMALVAATMTLGPTIYTCYHCSGDYTVMLLAIGQLTPWGFKMLNDGARGRQTRKAPRPSHGKSPSEQSVNHHDDDLDIEKPTKDDKSRDKLYTILGVFITIGLSASGWIGLVMLCIKMTYTLRWIWIIYAVGLVISPLLICAICISYDKESVWFTKADEGYDLNNFCSMLLMIMLFVVATFHIVGAHILLARITGNWSGIAKTGAGLASSITFFVGKRLLFFEVDCC